jgi:hypothetical protein
MKIRPNIGRKTARDERGGMIMESMGRGKLFGSCKKNWWRERIDWSSGCTKGVSTS